MHFIFPFLLKCNRHVQEYIYHKHVASCIVISQNEVSCVNNAQRKHTLSVARCPLVLPFLTSDITG